MVEGLEKTTARQELAVVVYDLTLLLIRLLLTALGAYAIQSQLRKADAADPDLDEARKKFYYAIAGYLMTILIGLFHSRARDLPLLRSSCLLACVPFRTLARAIFGGS